MTNVDCKNCGEEISIEASHCPKCGHPNRKVFCLSVSQLLLYLIVIIGILWVVVMGLERHFANKSSDNHEQVAAEAVEQYQLARQAGDHAKTCLHARIVTAIYLQANDNANYQHWKAIQEQECSL